MTTTDEPARPDAKVDPIRDRLASALASLEATHDRLVDLWEGDAAYLTAEEQAGLVKLAGQLERYQHNLTVRMSATLPPSSATLEDEGLVGLVGAWLAKVATAIDKRGRAVEERRGRRIITLS